MTVTDETISTVAGALYDAYRTSTPCDPVGERLAGGGIEAAYAAQEVNTRRWLAEGRRLVGRKIGLTSPAVQRQLGVGQPDYGMLFADMAVDEGAEVALGRLLQPRAEAEIAFVLRRDLPNPDATVAEVMQAIDFAVAAIEIVDSRIAGWKIGILDTVADNASSGLYVLGSRPVRLDQFDPLACGMVMERAGEPVSTGAGRACLGSPISAAAWLARTMAAANRPLTAGDTILSGALGPMVAVAPGDVVEARISGLGSVTAAFAGT
jgi:2-keto-4-pentenoate hydratase